MSGYVNCLSDLVPHIVKRKLEAHTLADLLVTFTIDATLEDMDIFRVELSRRWPKTPKAAEKCDKYLVLITFLAKNDMRFVTKLNKYREHVRLRGAHRRKTYSL